MFVVNDDLSIYATRGDTVFFNVSAHDHGYPYMFQPGDIVRMAIYGKKDAETCVMQKDFPVEEVTETVFVYLEEQDTKIGESISKHKDYWYEVVLNPDTIPQTIIGYDEDGAKIFRLFPESEEIHDEPVVEPEDIPVVDTELDMTSHRPVENQAVARAVATILDVCERTSEAVAKLHVTPQMFGAIGDGKADDTDALQMAIESGHPVYIPSGSVIYVPSGRTLTIDKSTVLYGSGESSVIRVAGTIQTDAKQSHTLEMYGFKFECFNTTGTSLIIEKENDANPCNALSIHDMWFYNRNNFSADLDNSIISIKGIREATISNCVFRGDSASYGRAIVFRADSDHSTMNITITECNFYYIGTFIEMDNTSSGYIYLAGIRLVNNMFIGGTYGLKAAYVDTLWVMSSMFDYVNHPIYIDSCGSVNITDNYLQTRTEGQCIYFVNNSTTEKRFNTISRNYLWSANESKNVDGIVLVGGASKISFSEICGNKSTALNRMILMKNCQNCKVTDNISHNSNTFFDGNGDSTIIEIKHNHADNSVANFNVNTPASCYLAEGNRHGAKPFHRYGKDTVVGDGSTRTFFIPHNMATTPVWAQVTSGSGTYMTLAVSYNETNLLVTFETAPSSGTKIVINWEARASIA